MINTVYRYKVTKEALMKLPTETNLSTAGINTFTFTGISLLWGHMLDLINPWFIPLTILCILVGYGSEVRRSEADNLKL